MRINAFINVGLGVDENKEIIDTRSDESKSLKERKKQMKHFNDNTDSVISEESAVINMY